MSATDVPGMDLLEAVLAFLREQNWQFETTEPDPPTLRMGFQGLNGRWSCYARIYPDTREFLFYSVFPVDSPPERRTAMMECLTRVNSGLTIGNFELDLEDGEILYKTSISAEGDRLTPQMVSNTVLANIETMDRYLPALLNVLYERASPAEAVAQSD
jgi:hypothetical protein